MLREIIFARIAIKRCMDADIREEKNCYVYPNALAGFYILGEKKDLSNLLLNNDI